jgi:acetylornithine/succinyldiaminopimelate/putrescine aminotransferase
MGALSVTWDDHYRAPFAPLVEDVAFVSASDPRAVSAAITKETAAVILEPLQGEGGVRPIPRATADAISAACRATGALLVADEVQCGLGRTGKPFYSSVLDLQPDLMALGKALGAGVPIGAALFSERVASSVQPGDHGSTYGGNLLACRAALVFVDELEGGLLDNVGRTGAHLEAGLRAIAARQPAVRDVRGAGLMWGLELDRPAAGVVQAALERKLLINRTSDTVIRLLPPYIIDRATVDEALPLLEAAITAGTKGTRA